MPVRVSGSRLASKMTSPTKLMPPVKSILRRPSVLGRRKADDDRDAEAEAMTEQKRRKVLFDEIGNSVHDITQGDARRQVLKALEEHSRGDIDDYQKLLECFGFGDGDEAPSLKLQEMPAYIVALANNAHLFKHKDHNHLVNSIIHMPWLGRDEPFLKAYMQFLASVLTTQNSRLGTVLQMLVSKFHDSHSSSWDLPDYPPIDRPTMRTRLHTCLQYMLRLFPAATPILRSTISNSLPYADSPVSEHVAYVDNLLRLREYASDLDDNIMDLILSHVVKIDVQMQVDLEDVDDDVSAAVAYLLKTADLTVEWEDRIDDEGDDDAESVDSADSDRDPKAEKIKFVKSSVDKMDAILDILFSLYARQFAKPDSPDSMACFATLIRQFTDIILPTYKSRHTQFLLFHISQLSDQLIDAFCGTCISIAFQSTKPNVIRQAAAAYLASFVARGANLGSETVRTAFTVLLRHAESLRVTYEPDCRGPNIKRYHTYYALCQAVFYIFCFRWRDLVMSKDEVVEADDPLSYLGQDLEWLPEMKELLSRNIYSKLNPVKVCAPSIVEEFAKMAHRLNLLYIFPLLASNKRVRLTQFISDTYMNGTALRDTGELGQEESYHQLDPYFPFDPYQLPVSKRWLDSDYLDWQPIAGLNQDDDGDESDEVDVDAAEDAIEDEETATDSEEEDD